MKGACLVLIVSLFVALVSVLASAAETLQGSAPSEVPIHRAAGG